MASVRERIAKGRKHGIAVLVFGGTETSAQSAWPMALVTSGFAEVPLKATLELSGKMRAERGSRLAPRMLRRRASNPSPNVPTKCSAE